MFVNKYLFIWATVFLRVSAVEKLTVYGEEGKEARLPCKYPLTAPAKELGVQVKRERNDDPGKVDYLFMYHYNVNAEFTMHERIRAENNTSILLQGLHRQDEQYMYKCVVTYQGMIYNTAIKLVVIDKRFGKVQLTKGKFLSSKINSEVQNLNPYTVLHAGSTLYLTAQSKAFRPPAQVEWRRNGTALVSNGFSVAIRNTTVASDYGYGSCTSELAYEVREDDEGSVITCVAVGPKGTFWAAAETKITITFKDGCCPGKPPHRYEGDGYLDWKMKTVLITGVLLLVLILTVLVILLVMQCRYTHYKLIERDKADCVDGTLTALNGDVADGPAPAQPKRPRLATRLWEEAVRKATIRNSQTKGARTGTTINT